MKFTIEYREYVSEFEAVSYYGHELTGVCKASEADVVNITFDERKFLKGIPSNWYVIEQMHIDELWFGSRKMVLFTEQCQIQNRLNYVIYLWNI